MDENNNKDVQVIERRMPNSEPKKKRNLIIAIVGIILLILLGVGAWFVLSDPTTEEATPEQETIEIQPTSTPVPTETPVPIERSEIRIQVLNGTGVSGEAGLLQEELEELGYEDIEAGNADNTDYEAAEVTFNEDLSPEAVTEITEMLEGMYVEVSTSTDSLDDFDVVIITGERQGMARTTATPTAGTTRSASPTSASTATPTP